MAHSYHCTKATYFLLSSHQNSSGITHRRTPPFIYTDVADPKSLCCNLVNVDNYTETRLLEVIKNFPDL